MKEIYILATQSTEPVPLDKLRETFEAEELEVAAFENPGSFYVASDESRVEVRFETVDAGLGWAPELITGTDESREILKTARGFYRISFTPGKPQPSIAVFEALWCARAIIEHVPAVLLDVTSFKLHDAADVAEITELDFDIRDHVNLHAIEATSGDSPLWVHSHGMEKFGMRDVEIFSLSEQDLLPAESFLHELCTDLAFGQGPPARALVETSSGHGFLLVPGEEARPTLIGTPLETFEGHEGLFFTIVSPEGRHLISDLLKPYRQRFEPEDPERTQRLKARAEALLPAFKARFQRKGLMEPWTFLVRATFETHPEGEPIEEKLWVEVLTWEEGTVIGKLVDGAVHTTEWRKGTHVEVEDEQINALAVSHEGQALDEEELGKLLEAERPS